MRGPIKIAERESSNGFAVSIPPEPGLTGESGGAADRTNLTRVRQGIEAAAGKFKPEWQPGNGRLFERE